MRTVAALCVGPRSVYKTLPDVEAYDQARDARTFPGGMPIVGHPPCRSWSAYCAHQAKPEPGERELALWVIEQLRREGGVLEQPAHSRLWAAAGLPIPGNPATRQPGNPATRKASVQPGGMASVVGVSDEEGDLAVLLWPGPGRPAHAAIPTARPRRRPPQAAADEQASALRHITRLRRVAPGVRAAFDTDRGLQMTDCTKLDELIVASVRAGNSTFAAIQDGDVYDACRGMAMKQGATRCESSIGGCSRSSGPDAAMRVAFSRAGVTPDAVVGFALVAISSVEFLGVGGHGGGA